MKLLAILLLATGFLRPTTNRPVELTPQQAISQLWIKSGIPIQFVRSGVSQSRFMEDAVPRLWAGLSPHDPEATALADRAPKVGLSLVVWKVGVEQYWLLGDAQRSITGAGRYLFRVNPRPAAKYLLQAPHAFFDRHTGAIAARLFFSKEGTSVRALFANSLHRYHESAGGPGTLGAPPSDLCHNPEHLFSTATLAARKAGAKLVLQLHGFGDKAVADDVTAVVSAGRSRQHTEDSARIATGLRMVLGPNVKLFPDEIQTLGATQNVQGRLVRDANGNGFVHVEMSLKTREALLNDEHLRANVAEALFKGEADP